MLGPGKPPGLPTKAFHPIEPPGGNQAPPAVAVLGGDDSNPARVIGFRMAVVLVFIYFSNIHQLLTYVVHINFYLLYLFGLPTLLGIALAGGIQRTMRGRPAIYWTVFLALLAAGVPFSSWKGGSVPILLGYIRTVYPMLFVIAGLTVTWKECRAMMWAIGSGGAVIMLAAKLFRSTSARYGERLAIEFGTIQNSNDYAIHLIFVIPFVIWIALASKSKALKLAAWGMAGFGVLLVLQTASRGALIALVAGVLYWLFRGTMSQKIALLALGPVVAVGLIAFVPQSSLMRLVAFSSDDSDAPSEAIVSSDARRYLLKKSIEYTLERPIFGVGLAQFSAFEGERNVIVGDHGMWHDTHNSYTQVSSECGIPAVVVYIAAIVSTFLMMNKVYRQAGLRADCEDIRVAAFCIMLSITAYCAGILFVNFAYFFYLPLMSSLVIAVCTAANAEFVRRGPGAVQTPVYAAPQWGRPADYARGIARPGGRAAATTKTRF